MQTWNSQKSQKQPSGAGIFHFRWGMWDSKSRSNLLKVRPWWWRRWAINWDISGSTFNEVQSQLLTKAFLAHTFGKSAQIAKKLEKMVNITIFEKHTSKTLMEYYSSWNRQANLKRGIIPNEHVGKLTGVEGKQTGLTFWRAACFNTPWPSYYTCRNLSSGNKWNLVHRLWTRMSLLIIVKKKKEDF